MNDFLQSAKTLMSLGNYIQAMEFLQAEIERNPTQTESYLLLADCFENLRKHRDALSTLYRLLSIDPNNRIALSKIENMKSKTHTSQTLTASNSSTKKSTSTVSRNNTQTKPNQSNLSTSQNGNATAGTKRQANNQTTHQQFLNNYSSATTAPSGAYYAFSHITYNNTIFLKRIGINELEVVEPVEHQGWTGFTRPIDKVAIPPYIIDKGNSLTVTSIGQDAFRNCYEMKAIAIPGTITSIKANAFEGCMMLKDVKLPNSVTLLGKEVFKDCVSLEHVSISRRLSTFYNGLFDGCLNLRQIIIGKGMTAALLKNNSFLSNKQYLIQENVYQLWKHPDIAAGVHSTDDTEYLDSWIKALLVLSGIAGFLITTFLGALYDSDFLLVVAILGTTLYIFLAGLWYGNFTINMIVMTLEEKKRHRVTAIISFMSFWIIVTVILILTKAFSPTINI